MSLRVYVYSIAFILLASSLVTAARTCTDSDDGKTFDVQGTVTGKGARNKDYSHEDSCINTGAKGRLLEWFCKGKVPKSMKKRCSCENGACIATTSTTRTTTTKKPTTTMETQGAKCREGDVCKYSDEDCISYCLNLKGTAGGIGGSAGDCNTRWLFTDICCKCGVNYPCNALFPTSFCLMTYGKETPEKICSDICSGTGRTMTWAGKLDYCRGQTTAVGVCCACQGSYQPHPEDAQPTQADQQCWKEFRQPGAICVPATEDCDKYCKNYGGKITSPLPYGNCIIDEKPGRCCTCTKHNVKCNALLQNSIDLGIPDGKTGVEKCTSYCSTENAAYVKSAEYSISNIKHVCCKCQY